MQFNWVQTVLNIKKIIDQLINPTRFNIINIK